MKKSVLIIGILSFILHFSFFNAHAQWQQTNGISTATVRCLAAKGDTLYAGTYGDGLFLSTNNGGTWSSVDSVSGSISCIAIKGGNIFVGTVETPPIGIHLSTNNGASWISHSNGLNNYYVECLSINNGNIFAGTAIGLYLSTDNGANWFSDGLWGDIVQSIAISGNYIFAGTDGFMNIVGLMLSTNNGKSWNYNDFQGTSIFSLAISGKNVLTGTGMESVGAGIFLSTNNGVTWANVNNGLPDSFVVYSFATYGNYIFAATGNQLENEGGVFLSSDNGENWNSIGMSNYEVFSLVIKGDSIFAGTIGAGVWKRALCDMIQCLNPLINNNELLSIYPNPANQLFNINYQLPTTEQVTLKIYDIIGREVAILLNETKDKGQYTLKYNSEDLRSGVYCVKLITNNNGIKKVVKFMKANYY